MSRAGDVLVATLLVSGLAACGTAEQSAEEAALYPASALRWPSRQVAVCFEDPSPAQATERAWVEDAVRTSWDAVSALEFTGFGACVEGQPGIHIRVEDTGPFTRGLGTQLDGVTSGMVLNFTFTNWSPVCQDTREFCIRAGAIHEFGHALGFAHEQNRPDTPSWCTQEQGTDGSALIGAWDLDSVMNYCNPRWTGDGNLSRLDVLGVQAVYGRDAGDWVGALSTGPRLGDEAWWSSGHGPRATRVSLADVTGDGAADAIAYFESERRWWVAPWTGSGFGVPVLARENHGNPSAQALIGDVDGDGKADAFTYYSSSGRFWAALSDGTKFGPDALWIDRFGVGATQAFLADVTGDGKADAVTFTAATGEWWVAASTGSGFTAPARVVRGFGNSGATPLLGDVDGDGKSDLVVYFSSDASWWVSRSASVGTSARFGTPRRFARSFGSGATARFLADVDGDRRADAITYARAGGVWTAALSTQTAFAAPIELRRELGMALFEGLTTPIVGDVDGDRRADAVVVWR